MIESDSGPPHERRAQPLPPEQWRRVTIVGVGLLGGSLAAALGRHFPAIELVGVDQPRVLQSERACQLLSRAIPSGEQTLVKRALASSDLVFLSATIGGIEQWLPTALAEAALITDCGSTKRRLVEVALRCPDFSRFVPGHPMAGALGGLSGAHADLFREQPWVLCGDKAEPAALAAIRAMVEAIGARPVFLSPQEHDRVVATTSHVPRLMASSLVSLAKDNQAFSAAGPAFERLLRGAGGSTAVWEDILRSNRDEVAAALRRLISDLEQCSTELESGGELEGVLSLLERAEKARLDFRRRH